MKRMGLLFVALLFLVIGVQSAQAGIVGGADGTVEVVSQHSRLCYSDLYYGGKLTVISLEGDGTTPLGLFVYDEEGNLIDSDVDLGDGAVVTFVPVYTGEFTVVVKNIGDDANLFKLTTN